MMNTNTIGNKIMEARKKMNISQAELAQQIFISPQAVGKWERGESLPDIFTINRLAEIFKVDLNYFADSTQTTEVAEQPKEQKTQTPLLTNIKKKLGLGWNMSEGNWVDADFSGLSNLKDKFSASNMKNTKFIGSDLSDLMLKGNNVVNCDFSSSNLRNSEIIGSNLVENKYINCSFIDAKFAACEIKNCDFSGANLSGMEIHTSEIKNCELVGTILNQTSFALSGLSSIVFGRIIENCSFDNCSFSKVTFKDAVLTNTFFKGKKLKGISFENCQADRMTFEFLKAGKADVAGLTVVES